MERIAQKCKIVELQNVSCYVGVGGESRVRFTNDNREFDSVSDKYIAQTKPAQEQLNKSTREHLYINGLWKEERLMAFLTCADIEMVPGKFALKIATLKWGEIQWGYDHGIFAWFDIVDIAQIKQQESCGIEQCRLVEELSTVGKQNIWQVSDTVKKLSELEPVPDDVSKQKFLYICLAWIFENRDKMEEPFAAVDLIYADFDYPEEIESFVSYMPVDSHRSNANQTLPGSQGRIHANWLQYLKKNGYREETMESEGSISISEISETRS